MNLLLGAGGLSLRLEDALHLLALSLAPDVSAETLLGELETSLVLGHLQQLEAALFVGREAGNLTHHLAHELDVLVLHALSAGRLHGSLLVGDHVWILCMHRDICAKRQQKYRQS